MYNRDAAGRLTGVVRPDSTTASATYDANDALTRIDGAAGAFIAYERDAAGRPTRVFDGTTESRFVWDALGRLGGSGASAFDLTYPRDADDRVSGIVYPDGTAVSYAYDAAGRLVSVTWPSGWVLYAWDADGRLVSISRSNGVVTVYTHGAGSRPHRAETRGATGTLIFAYEQVFDGHGRRTRAIAERLVAGVPVRGSPHTPTMRLDASRRSPAPTTPRSITRTTPRAGGSR